VKTGMLKRRKPPENGGQQGAQAAETRSMEPVVHLLNNISRKKGKFKTIKIFYMVVSDKNLIYSN